MSLRATNLILLLLVGALTVFPLAYLAGAEFNGADSQAETVVTEVAPDYNPWFRSLWEPPSAEVESFLFALQAAIGAGVIGYYLGYARGKKGTAGAAPPQGKKGELC